MAWATLDKATANTMPVTCYGSYAGDEDKACRSPSQASTTSAGSGSCAFPSPTSTRCVSSSMNEWARDEFDLITSQCSFAEWTVQIQRVSGGMVGFRTTPTRNGSALGVLAIVPDGQLQEWNENNAEDHIRLGDVILEVNGISGNSQAMIDELIKATQLNLRLTRAVRLPAVLDRQGGTGSTGLGLTLNRRRVENVHDNLQKRYIHTVPPELRIWTGDEVVIVNGRRQQADVDSQLAKAVRVELTLRRPLPGTLDAAAVVGTAATPAAPAATSPSGKAAGKSTTMMQALKSWPLAGLRLSPASRAEAYEPLL